jgi:hypothetical protein
MKIALIDNDFVSIGNHNFPNLALMKISSYHKSIGNSVVLTSFEDINPNTLFKHEYDKIYISKVFTESKTPDFIKTIPNVNIGGTGFYFDKAEKLPFEIEHIMPDYSLYNNVLQSIKNKKYYTESSIGFLTRGCFRHCEFCVNKNSNKVELHSPINEFVDNSKPIITLLDDNILGLKKTELIPLFEQLNDTKKIVEYKQGLDIRLINEEIAKTLLSIKHGEQQWYFAFDRFEDKDIIESKLKIWHDTYIKLKNLQNTKYIKTKIYCFCGMDLKNKYDEKFVINDLDIVFKRIEIMFRYKTVPYLMQFNAIKQSRYKDIYQDISHWCNSNMLTVIYLSLKEYLEKNKRFKTLEFLKKHNMTKYLQMSFQNMC